MKIKFQRVDSLVEEVERLQQRIARRALEIFRERGGAIGHHLEDWLKAERETVWRPAIEVVRTKDAFIVEAAIAGVDPTLLDVRVTATELLLAAELHHSDRAQQGDVVLCEFVDGPLLRTYQFPAPVDPARVSAEYHDGLLSITAPLANLPQKVAVQAA